MKINGKEISCYSIYVDSESECINYAASQLRFYILKAFGFTLDITQSKTDEQISLFVGYNGKKDGFRIVCDKKGLSVIGQSERGVLYGVYYFLEEFIGWRFFAGKMCFKGEGVGAYMAETEKLFSPRISEISAGFEIEEDPVILFRDMFGHATVDEDWCAKNRINGDIWKLKNMPPHLGGADTFVGQGGHSFNELLPEQEYFATHPEYYSEIDGIRHGGGNYQICLTNEELPIVVAENVKKLLKKYPGQEIVSVSQNDNGNFCRCARCQKAAKEQGLGNMLISFVNRVAALVSEDFPNVKIHTYAYEKTAQDCTVPLHKNVLLQYCLRYCRGHLLSDETCAVNKIIGRRLRELGAKCENLFIYDYRSGEKYTFLFMPDIFRFRENMRFLAECNVKGIYAETDIFCQNSPCMEELRAYVTAKLMWNPYMSEEEFNRHIDEFLQGYYGKGWKHIRKYLELWAEVTNGAHYDSVLGNVADESGRDLRDQNGPVPCVLFPVEKTVDVCEALEKEIALAEKVADETEKPRLEILHAAPLWYRLFHTMESTMLHGSAEEKKQMITDNKKLCSIMRGYCMKFTVFIAMNETTAMFKDFTLPPSQWIYWPTKRYIFDEIQGIGECKNEKN